MIQLSAFTVAAAVLAVIFVALWTATARSLFWDRLLGPGRLDWTAPRAFAASALCAALNLVIVSLLFGPHSDLRLFIFCEVTYYLFALACFRN